MEGEEQRNVSKGIYSWATQKGRKEKKNHLRALWVDSTALVEAYVNRGARPG